MNAKFHDRLQKWADLNDISYEFVPSVVSTNLTAREKPCAAGTLIVTDHQTDGRGQRGNSWLSNPGENLLFSIVLEPGFLPADKQFYLSKVVALALADTLAGMGIDARIKWPNDIYAGDRKIAGMLIENDVSGRTLRRSVIGVGLNVNQVAFSPDLPNPTSAALETGMEQDRAHILMTFYGRLAVRYAHLAEERYEALDRAYLKRLYRLGEESSFADRHGKSFRGVILGTLPTGELHLRHTDDDTPHTYLFKEIEYLSS